MHVFAFPIIKSSSVLHYPGVRRTEIKFVCGQSSGAMEKVLIKLIISPPCNLRHYTRISTSFTPFMQLSGTNRANGQLATLVQTFGVCWSCLYFLIHLGSLPDDSDCSSIEAHLLITFRLCAFKYPRPYKDQGRNVFFYLCKINRSGSRNFQIIGGASQIFLKFKGLEGIYPSKWRTLCRNGWVDWREEAPGNF